MRLAYEYAGTAIVAIQFVAENDLDRRIQDVMYQHPGSLRVGRHQEHIHITFLTPDGQNTAVVRDPPDATMEELLKRIIAIEDRLTRQAA